MQPSLLSTPVQMTSKEIADLTGKRHANVLRDIQVMLTQAFDLQDNSELSYTKIQGVTVTYDEFTKRVAEIALNKRLTVSLLSGYDVKARLKIIDRLEELEREKYSQQNLVQSSIVKQTLVDYLDIGSIFGVPVHIAQKESVKIVKDQTGVDLSQFLLSSPAQDNIKDEEIMLEPTELAEVLGVKSGRAMNTLLQNMGLQVKVGTQWQPTETGKDLCIKHFWVSKNSGKDGYNLKWKVEAIKEMLQ